MDWKYIGLIILLILAVLFVFGSFRAVSICNETEGYSWNGFWGFCENQTPDFWELGFFGINDLYNTCIYFSSETGVMFDGYCYKELPSPDRALESCITGCKLGTSYGEDANVCFFRCKNYLIELN